MSDYTYAAGLAAKDALPSGNAGKVISGAGLETEFVNIQTAIATKQDIDATLTALAGTLTAANKIPYATALNTASELTLSTSTSLGTSDTTLSSQKAVKSYVDTQLIIASGTTQASTSGTSIDFTGIPSTVKRITINLVGVSTNGTSLPLVQIGDSGGIETTAYLGASSSIGGVVATTTFTTGVGIYSNTAPSLLHGSIILSLQESSTYTWVFAGLTMTEAGTTITSAGSKSLSTTLDRVRITTVDGVDTFDAGSINILYE